MGPLPGPVRGSDSLKFLLSPVIYKAAHGNGCVTLAASPAPPAAAGTLCGSPRPPGGRRLGTAVRPESRSAPSGVGGPRGAALRPLPTPTQPPRDWERKGEARPRPRTAPSGLEAVLEGGGNPWRGQRDRLPPPKTRPLPAPCWRRPWLQDPRRPVRTPHGGDASARDRGDPSSPRPPALAPGEVTPGVAPPPNLPPSPALGRRGFHAGGDSPPKATSNTRTLVGGHDGLFTGALHPGL